MWGLLISHLLFETRTPPEPGDKHHQPCTPYPPLSPPLLALHVVAQCPLMSSCSNSKYSEPSLQPRHYIFFYILLSQISSSQLVGLSLLVQDVRLTITLWPHGSHHRSSTFPLPLTCDFFFFFGVSTPPFCFLFSFRHHVKAV